MQHFAYFGNYSFLGVSKKSEMSDVYLETKWGVILGFFIFKEYVLSNYVISVRLVHFGRTKSGNQNFVSEKVSIKNVLYIYSNDLGYEEQ